MNLENQFEIIVKGDFQELSKHIYRKRIFHKGDFTHVMSFLTIIQDIYNKSNELEKHLKNKSKDISNHLSPFINVYFDKYTNYDILNISKYAASLIEYEMSELLPGAEYAYPNYIEYIKIAKDDKIYLFEEKQTYEDIKKAQEYIIEWLQL
jgi:hypothetical protein